MSILPKKIVYTHPYRWTPGLKYQYTLATCKTKRKPKIIRYLITVTHEEDVVIIDGEPTDKHLPGKSGGWKHITNPLFIRNRHQLKPFRVSIYHQPLDVQDWDWERKKKGRWTVGELFSWLGIRSGKKIKWGDKSYRLTRRNGKVRFNSVD